MNLPGVGSLSGTNAWGKVSKSRLWEGSSNWQEGTRRMGLGAGKGGNRCRREGTECPGQRGVVAGSRKKSVSGGRTIQCREGQTGARQKACPPSGEGKRKGQCCQVELSVCSLRRKSHPPGQRSNGQFATLGQETKVNTGRPTTMLMPV